MFYIKAQFTCPYLHRFLLRHTCFLLVYWLNYISYYIRYLNVSFAGQLFYFLPQDLVKNLKSELKGKLEEVVLCLMMSPAEFDAMQLRKAMKVRVG